MGERREHWVFAYGSLMWDPGFPVAEMVSARLDGYARSFCLRSVVYRGTSEVPGLVLGLDAEPGAHCRGLALRVAEPEWEETLAALRERELTTNAYAELSLPLVLEDGRAVEAVAYVIRRDHDQYAGPLDLHEQARIIARAQGGRGPNADYLFNTARHLAQMGIEDHAMDELARQVRGLLHPGRE
ncbi:MULTISPECIES: gamma-glutamylcyclotransferase [Paracoccus]|jgi:cation transport protein ChaC|uniref:glutathione-specific gamma-glutamylcyclotransferase n=1 Tax=Paracoccus denitrificans (strain Pd 1222) TaxID=318586 RepID=A1B1W3_PARDP|nr:MULTISPECIES: gamma-glutamylcyclotransferase [Paracoccus]ABL69507.1 ChaC family protein [Paracoccus denitrificans PD1222]MBB4626755.1 cation transport protein ChaC [Paracoccus denitrificans]MCU7427762.1 gamma-glutamylcyclotransferase [Paracoccus denitrificans]MDK8873185.1 gamma-glutamylcyclotransferase [Paracoccus sp. SSJ]QAR25018.1 gamma-glutamylcyclotransferase [Paracoccus denitrificans]